MDTSDRTQHSVSCTNEYDDASFFNEYAKMARSQNGLPAAGEWHQLRPLFPPLQGKRVLDLGCGYGWHCKFAEEQGAAQVLGIDLSRWMLKEAKNITREQILNTGFAISGTMSTPKTPGIA